MYISNIFQMSLCDTRVSHVYEFFFVEFLKTKLSTLEIIFANISQWYSDERI